MSLSRWPDTDALYCGCRVALKAEGDGDIVLYFPCDPQCSTLTMTKTECEKAGKKWEKRHVSHN